MLELRKILTMLVVLFKDWEMGSIPSKKKFIDDVEILASQLITEVRKVKKRKPERGNRTIL